MPEKETASSAGSRTAVDCYYLTHCDQLFRLIPLEMGRKIYLLTLGTIIKMMCNRNLGYLFILKCIWNAGGEREGEREGEGDGFADSLSKSPQKPAEARSLEPSVSRS